MDGPCTVGLSKYCLNCWDCPPPFIQGAHLHTGAYCMHNRGLSIIHRWASLTGNLVGVNSSITCHKHYGTALWEVTVFISGINWYMYSRAFFKETVAWDCLTLFYFTKLYLTDPLLTSRLPWLCWVNCYFFSWWDKSVGTYSAFSIMSRLCKLWIFWHWL